jgi:Family of unknown function (DUF5681)
MSREVRTQENVKPTFGKAGTGSQSAAADYKVGRNRPPVEHRFKPGQSGNRKGRPKGRQNLKTEIKNIVNKKVTVRDGEKTSKLSLLAANVLAHGLKGAKGDARSSGLFVSYTQKMGYLEEQMDQSSSDTSGVNPYPVPKTPADHLLVGLDVDRLTRDEQVELSRLCEEIDLAGHVATLSTAKFERFKLRINKGHGKDGTY